jgi:hypothetical protein
MVYRAGGLEVKISLTMVEMPKMQEQFSACPISVIESHSHYSKNPNILVLADFLTGEKKPQQVSLLGFLE